MDDNDILDEYLIDTGPCKMETLFNRDFLSEYSETEPSKLVDRVLQLLENLSKLNNNDKWTSNQVVEFLHEIWLIFYLLKLKKFEFSDEEKYMINDRLFSCIDFSDIEIGCQFLYLNDYNNCNLNLVKAKREGIAFVLENFHWLDSKIDESYLEELDERIEEYDNDKIKFNDSYTNCVV